MCNKMSDMLIRQEETGLRTPSAGRSASETPVRLEKALDYCRFEDKKMKITGREDGCTCAEFAAYVMETLTTKFGSEN